MVTARPPRLDEVLPCERRDQIVRLAAETVERLRVRGITVVVVAPPGPAGTAGPTYPDRV